MDFTEYTLPDFAETQSNTTASATWTEKYTEVTETITPQPYQSDIADDAIWILTSTFIIFTMQSGFGLLESGSVTAKNEANIMVKNAVDVIFGGLTYWMYGYAFSFGRRKPYANAFTGWGNFFAMVDKDDFGSTYAKFFFQASFATTATTIVSAHWVWDSNGWLAQMGIIDIAGCGPVHLVGGTTGLVATLMLKPRYKRVFNTPNAMGSPTNVLLGAFMLWWGWLGFNCGSTFGISGAKWKLATRSAASTMTSSIGGGAVGLISRSAVTTMVASIAGGIFGVFTSYILKKKRFDICFLVNGLLGSLVSITAFCAFADPWESYIIGTIGAMASLTGVTVIERLKIDDPVGAVGVHGFSSVWGLIAVGLFAKEDSLVGSLGFKDKSHGVFYGGGFYLLGVQLLAIVSLISWTVAISFILLKFVDITIGLRIPLEEEILGADIVEHGLGDYIYDKNDTNNLQFSEHNAENGEVGGNRRFSLSSLKRRESPANFTTSRRSSRRHSAIFRQRRAFGSKFEREEEFSEEDLLALGYSIDVPTITCTSESESSPTILQNTLAVVSENRDLSNGKHGGHCNNGFQKESTAENTSKDDNTSTYM